MARAVLCPNCGSKIRAGRERCPRCRALIQAPDSAASAAESRRLARIAVVVSGVFLVGLAVLWFMRAPAPSAHVTRAPADPLGARRAHVPDTPAAQSGNADIPFLEPAGAGHVAYAAGDYAAALAQFQTAVEKNPDDAEALSNLGQVLVRLNRAADAIPYYQRAIAILPDRWAYQFNLARAYGLVGRMEDSVAAYKRAQELFPDDYVTAFNLALALHKSGDDAAAVEQYEKAIASNPDDASFRMALANSYERLRKPAEAAGAYEEYLRLSPAAPDADKVRARIAELTGAPGRVERAQGGL